MIRYIKVNLRIIRNALIRDLKIPGFVLVNILTEGMQILTLVTLFTIIFRNTPELVGWSYWQVLFLYFYSRVIFDLDQGWTRKGLRELAKNLIRKGDLDFFLMKPIDPLFLVAVNKPRVYKMLTCTANLFIAIYCAHRSGIPIHTTNVLWFVFLTLFGIVLFFSLNVITAIPTFWWIKVTSFSEITSRLGSLIRYPAGIYSMPLKIIFFVLFPLLVITYIPVSTLFYPPKPLYIAYAVCISVVFYAFARVFWRIGLKHYSSASS